MDDDVFIGRTLAGIVGGIFVIWLLVFIISFASARTTPQAGEIGVVRNGPSFVWVGSWFNDHKIRKVVPPGSGNTGIGLGSDVHYYPADSVQRNYTITSQAHGGDRPGVDIVEVPTSDGIRVGLEGTFYFTTASTEVLRAKDSSSVLIIASAFVPSTRRGLQTTFILGKVMLAGRLS